MSKKKLFQFEPLVFLFFVILNIIPVIANSYFPTVDGPAHLYNANLLKHLWTYNDHKVASFFDVNSNINSNWFIHIYYLISGTIFSASVSDKILLTAFIFAFSYGFRLLLAKANDYTTSLFSSYLIFPFIYSFTLCIGFFNFTIGIAFIFLITYYWFKIRASLLRKQTLLFCLLLLIIFYTHVLDFLVVMLLISFYELIEAVKSRSKQKLFFLFLASAPSLILLVVFILNNKSTEAFRFIEREELNKWLLHLSPIVIYNYDDEKLFSLIVFLAISSLFSISVIKFLKRGFKKENISAFHIAVAFCILFLLALYYTMPDNMFSGGFLSMRISYFLLLFVILFCSLVVKNIKVIVLPVVFCLIANVLMVRYHYYKTKHLSNEAKDYERIASFMEEGSILLPLNYSDNWLHNNFSSYAGTEKLIFILDNYEAEKPHFPLRWKENQNPQKSLGNVGHINPCLDLDKYERVSGKKINYISKWKYSGNTNNLCTAVTDSIIKVNFIEVYKSVSGSVILYKRKG